MNGAALASQIQDPTFKDERESKVREGLLVHATLEENLPKIVATGIHPQSAAECRVWGLMPSLEQERMLDERGVLERVCEMRESSVYGWDDVQAATEHALVSAGQRGSGNPAIVVADIAGRNVELDPEVHHFEAGEEDSPAGALARYPEDPRALALVGSIPASAVLFTCTLDDATKVASTAPTVGHFYKMLTDQLKAGEAQKNFSQSLYGMLEDFEDRIRDVSNWTCTAARNPPPPAGVK